MHIPAVDSHPQAEVVAVCGRKRENGQKLADRWNIAHVFTDYDEMLESDLLDAVIVSTPNHIHHLISMKAMEQGLHVLCEKPLALSYADALEMAETAEEKRLICMTPFTYRFMPTARYLKELMDDGYIGKPYHLNMRYYTGYARDGKYHWRFNKDQAGSGILGDLASHFLYLAMWYFGDVESVSCQLGYNVERDSLTMDGEPYTVGDDMAVVTIQFENGAYGVVHATAVCYENTPFGQTHHMEFHGSDGTLYHVIDWDRVQEVKGARVGEGMVKTIPIPEHIWGQARHDTVHNTYRDLFRVEDYMIRGWLNGILKDEAVQPDFAEGAKVQRILEACAISHETGCRVQVESIGAKV